LHVVEHRRALSLGIRRQLASVLLLTGDAAGPSVGFLRRRNMTGTYGEREGNVTSMIESGTSKVPSGGYLAAAVSSMAASAVLKILGKDEWSLFVGQWAPAFLIIGVYNKLVKLQGSDAYTRAA
jgi:hypothetical protein